MGEFSPMLLSASFLLALILGVHPSTAVAAPPERPGAVQGAWIEYECHNDFKGYTLVLAIQKNGGYRLTKTSSREKAPAELLSKGKLSKDEQLELGKLVAASGFMRLEESYDVSGGVLDAPVSVIALRVGGRAKKVSVMTADNEGAALPVGLGGLYRWLDGKAWSRPKK